MASGYWIANAKVNDPQGQQEYARLAGPAIAKFGGKLKSRGANCVAREGAALAGNYVIVEFPSYQAAVDCYNSPEYQKALPLRLKAAAPGGSLCIVEGVD
jgi:uncharacterized protein (DUF1330 family)